MSIINFFKKNTILCIAIVAALITMFIVPPDAQYLGYFDYKTLTCLFCVLAVVCAFKNINFFYILARKVVESFRTARMCVIALVYITFIGSMLIANDMALLTFLPLGYYVLTTTNKQKYMAFTFIMQNIAANIGNIEFMRIMFPPFLLSIILITICCFIFVKNDGMGLQGEPVKLDGKKAVLYTLLFALSIAIVFRTVPYVIGLVIVPVVLFFVDKKALKMVDYPLLFTFVSFFIFSSNMARIDIVREFFCSLLEKNTLIFSVLSCQFISNVPSAILLSQFTNDYPDLLVGVNIGGVGTLIASLASLITFREYTKNNPGKMLYYIGVFSAFNFAFLIVLTIFEMLI